MLQLAVVPFALVSTLNLERLAKSVIPRGQLRVRGKSDERYRSYLAGRCAIKALLSSYDATLQVAPNLEYGYLEVWNGKGRKEERLFINVSHTGFISVAALSDFPVGVDLESRARSAEKVLSRVATDRERTWIHEGKEVESDLPIRKDIFLWSAKEAASKAFGLGMKFGLQTFEILPTQSAKMFHVETSALGPFSLEKPSVIFETWEEYFITLSSEESVLSRGIDRRIIGLSDI